MPDDMLEDAITVAKNALETHDFEEQGVEVSKNLEIVVVANEVFVVFRLHQLSRNTWTRDGSLSGTFSWAKVSAVMLCTKGPGLCTSASNKAKSRF